MWTKKKLLIWGKTYPEFSTKYYETVCTGAVDEETGKLVRIYPLTLRHLKEKFRSYDWIEADVQRNSSDFRPESFKINQDTFKVVGHIGTKPGEWHERSRLVLQPQNIFASVESLQAAEKSDHTSLGLVRPKEIKRIYKIKRKESERKEWDEARARAVQQRDLFVDPDSMAKELAFCPVEYRVKFTCDDSACTTEHDFSIRDWGLYVLDYNQWADRGGAVAEEKVVEKIQQLMDPTKRDPYFFLGNTKGHSQSFMVVGLFHPPLKKPTLKAIPTATPMLPGIV
jgi:hypothetical protein